MLINSKSQSEEIFNIQDHNHISKYYTQDGNILSVINEINILQIFSQQTTLVHAYKNMPEQFQSDMAFYMFNFIISKVSCLSVILFTPKKNKKNLFTLSFFDSSMKCYQLQDILGINKKTMLLKCSFQQFDRQVNFNKIANMMIQINEMISQSHEKLQAINQSLDMFEMDNQLNDLVEKINNVCSLLPKDI